MVNCAAYGCRSGYKSQKSTTDGANEGHECVKDTKLSYHAFPIHHKDLCDNWVRAIRRNGFVATKYSKLCSLHFKETDFIAESRDSNKRRRKCNNKLLCRRYLKDDAVPSILPIAPQCPTNTCGVPWTIVRATARSQLEHEQVVMGQMDESFLAEDGISKLSTSEIAGYSQDTSSTRRKRNREKRASFQRYLKKDAIPSVSENAAEFVSCKPQTSTRITLENRLEKDRNQLATSESAFTADDDASHSILSGIHDEIVNETATPKGSTISCKNKMVYKCSGVGCRSGYRDCAGVDENGEKITFHSFPIGNPELCEKWIRANLRKDFIPTKHSKLCSLHFLPGDFIQEVKNANVSRQKKRALVSEKPNRRHLKDDAVPSVFPNASAGSCLLETQVASRIVSGASSPSRYPEEERMDSLQQASPEIDDISGIALGIEEQLKDKKCDITFNMTGRHEHFIKIAETLIKYRENGILCDAVLVAKCGRELKAHSALLSAVSPVFLMAIQEKPSSGLYHLCFPEVELEVLEIAVHFVYTGKLLLPPLYSQMNRLSKLFDKLSVLGLSSLWLHECEMTFVRCAKQPPNSSKPIKFEDADNAPSLKDSVPPKLQASCEWSVDKNPSFANTSNEAMIGDVASIDARTEGNSVESSRGTLSKGKEQGYRKREWQERRPKKSLNNNFKKERMANNYVVPSDTVVPEPVMKPAFSVPKSLMDLSTSAMALTSSDTGLQQPNNVPAGLLFDQNTGKINTFNSDSIGIHEAIVNDNGEPSPKAQGDILNLIDPSPTEGTLAHKVVEMLVDKAGVTSGQVLTCEHCKEPITETFTSEIDLLWHKIKHHWDLCNMCNYCGRRFSVSRNLIYHIKRHLGINPEKTHKCNDCGMHFLTPKSLKDHRVRHTGEKPHECPECKKHFSLKENMLRHKLLHAGYHSFLCDFCGKGFTRKTALTDHVTVHHEFECALCSCKQTSKADMQKHALEVHQLGELVSFNSIIKNPETYLCDHCGKNCISVGSLRYHIKVHRKKPVHCKTYGNMSSWLHTGKRPFVCNVCQKGFPYKSYLMTHLAIHSEFKPFGCIICSKSFASKGQLKRHMKRHTMNLIHRKQFICEICNNQFTTKSSLIAHHRIHTSERPYKCMTCGKQFNCKSTLTIHFRMHTGNKPFPCTVCEKSFTQSQHLSRHMRSHTGEKPFVCEICGKSYKNKIDLRFHFMRFHKIDVASKSASKNTDADRTVKVPA